MNNLHAICLVQNFVRIKHVKVVNDRNKPLDCTLCEDKFSPKKSQLKYYIPKREKSLTNAVSEET